MVSPIREQMVSIREYTRGNTECVQIDSVSEAEMFLGKSVIKTCSKFTEEHPRRRVILIMLICNFIEITLQLGCFFCKFAAYFQNTFSYISYIFEADF